jgi:hypothetical protein
MPFKLRVATEQEVPLNLPTDIDPEQNSYVRVRQATAGDNAERDADIEGQIERVYNPDRATFSVRTLGSAMRLRAKEAYLTLSGTNLQFEDGRPLFAFQRTGEQMRFAGTFEEFLTRWNLLPQPVADAISRAVYQVNPEWDPNRTFVRS